MPSFSLTVAKLSGWRIAKRVIMFCLPLLMGWIALEWWAARMPNSYSVKRAQVEALSSEIDTLIIGSSSAYYGISPKQMPGMAYNLANVSQTLFYDYRITAKVLPKLPKLRRVIIAINYISLFDQLNQGQESWRQYYYNQEWQIAPASWRDRLDIRMWSPVAIETPRVVIESAWVGFNAFRRGKDYMPKYGGPMDDRGWWCREHPDASGQSVDSLAAQVALTRHNKAIHPSNEAANLADLECLIRMLRERNIEVILITLPVSASYADGMKMDVWKHALEILKDLDGKYNTRYISFLREPQMTGDDFLDADHLNTQGARHFTTILNSALETPIRR